MNEPQTNADNRRIFPQISSRLLWVNSVWPSHRELPREAFIKTLFTHFSSRLFWVKTLDLNSYLHSQGAPATPSLFTQISSKHFWVKIDLAELGLYRLLSETSRIKRQKMLPVFAMMVVLEKLRGGREETLPANR